SWESRNRTIMLAMKSSSAPEISVVMTVVCRGHYATPPPLLLPTVLSEYANISPSTHELPLVTTAAEETATATPAVTTLALRLLLLPDSRSSRREGNSETVMYGCSPKKKVNYCYILALPICYIQSAPSRP